MSNLVNYPNLITAEEAKKLSDQYTSTNSIAIKIYERIKKAAKEGMVSILYDLSHMDLDFVEIIEADLITNGYTVTKRAGILTIYWSNSNG